ncbi:HAMP domain-containing sensor histidine kinase [Phycicoccus sonneratiae]|uniref:histidine kinase n=1 Tax=Phycicoccus sonneratiae TaxID=2807628 RepID=A0ABS2CR47_9MICO|nr:HAMP domain-containing sensor histidine kinase [Phycicoccus sonneraticus]MBM6402362.1 HAMP domain-containing histidine kinase [Phycicoccus sonneraticus]
MRPAAGRLGIRATSTASFALLALVVSTLLAVGTYLTARHYLVGQREATATRQAFVDAALLREGLLTAGSSVSDVLDETSPPPGAVVLVDRSGQWYTSSLETGEADVPADVRAAAAQGRASRAWTTLAGGPAVVVGVPVPAVGVAVYEISPTTELQSTLRTLAVVLAAFAAGTTAVGALLGGSASARTLAPLRDVASAAAAIAAGRMTTRLPDTSDPDLAVIVGSFNSMVEALEERMQRDARFAADVAHELRSPVTTLMTSVTVLRSAQGRDPERQRAAADLVDREVRRLHRSLEHLLELGRLDAGVLERDPEPMDLEALVRHTLADTGRAHVGVEVVGPLTPVEGSKPQLHRALVNLLENADRHGGGVEQVLLRSGSGSVEVLVVDRGPGVPDAERSRVFDRFSRIGSRGSTPGTGLGLSLVAETVRAHGGRVWVEETPGGGATFVIGLPAGGDGAEGGS